MISGNEIQYLDPLSATDRAIIDGLTQDHLTPWQILPDSTPFMQILPTLELCCGTLDNIELTKRKITPLVGRLMILVQLNPEVHHRLGYTSFNKFCRNHMAKLGYARPSVYLAMYLVKLNPALTLGDWVKIGIDRIKDLSKFCKADDPSYDKYLHAARTMNFHEWQGFLARQGMIQAGDTQRVPVVFAATKTVSQIRQKFMDDPRVHEVVGSSDQGRIEEAMVQECSGEWLQERTGPLASGVSWRCDWCHAKGDINLRKERTLDGLTRIITDNHRQVSPDCDYVDEPGQLTIFLDRG